jgi:hypothetical protein
MGQFPALQGSTEKRAEMAPAYVVSPFIFIDKGTQPT